MSDYFRWEDIETANDLMDFAVLAAADEARSLLRAGGTYAFNAVGGPRDGDLLELVGPYDSVKFVSGPYASLDELRDTGRYVRVGDWREDSPGHYVSTAEWRR